ncbi:hypothetical protein ABEG18_16675 [Alsobacter sp. KACC 23698]|uniref:Uncharacterized protein n=1 Tax=Alsobacter sp. KACC 23698 TaxID=3149229 RepID=A0AAU7JAN1_9HYPH
MSVGRTAVDKSESLDRGATDHGVPAVETLAAVCPFGAARVIGEELDLKRCMGGRQLKLRRSMANNA